MKNHQVYGRNKSKGIIFSLNAKETQNIVQIELNSREYDQFVVSITKKYNAGMFLLCPD